MFNYFRARGLAVVALSFSLLFVAGCASLSQKIADKATEKVLETASGGNVKIDSEDGSVAFKGADGSVVVGGGSSRPESAPEDLPSVAGAKDFTWLGGAGSGMFAYDVAGNDYKKVCADQIDLLLKAGWQKSDEYEVAVEKMMTKSMTRPEAALSITCADSTDDGSTDYKVGIVLNKTKK